MHANCDAAMTPRPASRTGLWLLAGGVLALALLFRAQFAFCIAKGESMLPNLRSGDLVLVDKLAYRNQEPERGDIVVARLCDGLIVKRVVGLPGEEIELRQGRLHVNQHPLAEPYGVKPGPLSLRKGRLLEARYALLGDNRSTSSSLHAVASKDQILGKVIRAVHLWPDWLGTNRDQTVGQTVQSPGKQPEQGAALVETTLWGMDQGNAGRVDGAVCAFPQPPQIASPRAPLSSTP